MQKGYIVVKTRQGEEMAKLSKVVDRLCERMEIVCFEKPHIGIEEVTLAVYEFCEETMEALNEISTMFELLPGNMNSRYYRDVIKDAGHGKRRRLRMRTYCGDRLFRACVSVDRMCIVVSMLAREQRITKAQASRFFQTIEEIVRQLVKVRLDLGKILKNAETDICAL